MAFNFLGMISLMMVFVSCRAAKRMFGILGIIMVLLIVGLSVESIIIFKIPDFFAILLFAAATSIFALLEKKEIIE